MKAIDKAEMRLTVMVLTSDPSPLYLHRCLEAGADFLAATSEEFERVSGIVRQLAIRTKRVGPMQGSARESA